jgi:hypothetical protein
MLHELAVNTLYAVLFVYGLGVFIAFIMEILTVTNDPYIQNGRPVDNGGIHLFGAFIVLCRSCLSWFDVYIMCRLEPRPVRIRKD